MTKIGQLFYLVCAFIALASCGGGGESGGDGNVNGSGDTNVAPIANAGINQTVGVNVVVSLSGVGSSDSNGDSLTYSWSLNSVPNGSSASLTNTSGATTEITTDEFGEYVVSLVVNDGTVDSNIDLVTITATDGNIDSLGLTDIELRDSSAGLIAEFYTPAPMSERLALERSVVWNEFTGMPTNLTRFSFGDDTSDNLFSIADTDITVNASLIVSADLAAESSVTNDILLSSTFQFVEIDTNSYAIFSSKHSNYALSEDGANNIIVRDVRSTAAHNTGTASLLTFSIGTSPLALVANGRYVIDGTVNDSIAYTEDISWTNQEVVLNGIDLQLAATGGTSMKLYDAPIKLDIPTDFNPDDITRVSNAEFYDANRATTDSFDSGIANLNAVYEPQTAVAGSDAGTLAAVNTMLNSIESSLAAQGSQMRYPREFYLALREGMFKRAIQSSESFNGEMGDLTTPYIYFTNQTDDNGDYHPFMVVASRNIPDGFSHLRDVTRPPGDGQSGTFNDQNVTRGFFRKNYLLKIPLRDYGEVATPGENTNVPVFSASGDDHHAYASTGQVGVAIDGVLVFPSFNNQGRFSQELGEISAIGLHAGTGLDAHYHADPHSAALINDNRDSGLNFYNEEDYVGRNHPPITSVGLDGVAGYGFYLEGDTASDGATVPLDDFGAHEHHDYGYHYHSLRDDQTVNGMPYTTHEMGPLGAWAGRANFMPDIEVGERNTVSQWVGNDGTAVTPPAELLSVSSSAIQSGGILPDNLKCDRDGGTGDSPPIQWTGTPVGTESIAVIMEHYPEGTVEGVDIPSQYWLLWNVPADTTSIAQGNPSSIGNEGSDKDGVMTGYTAPCSPGGDATNEYSITLYALDSSDIGLGTADDINVTWQTLTNAIDGSVLASSEIDFIN